MVLALSASPRASASLRDIPKTSVDVALEGVGKVFGTTVAVADVSLDIYRGEFFSLLGPSGSGKTTCLRMIAGFEEPSSGRISLSGIDVTHRAPFERDVNTVFQDYALFPHMNVRQNVEYGLKVKDVPASERARRVPEALRMVRLEGFEKRKPAELSGGQRQRVALARALVNEPRVVLLDEPLGALDLKLRQQMQSELKAIQQRVGLTFIYVTHDQEEAVTMSDRMAVMNEGRIEQVGTPAEIYERPVNAFVAGFVGISNVLPADVAEKITGERATISVRPEKIRIIDADDEVPAGFCTATGTVEEVVYVGAHTRFVVSVEGASLVVLQQNLEMSSMGALEVTGRPMRLAWNRLHNRKIEGTGRDGGRGALEEGEV